MGSSKGVESARRQLFMAAEDVKFYAGRLAEARRVRDLLVVKLAKVGDSTRATGARAGLSSQAIDWIVRKGQQ